MSKCRKKPRPLDKPEAHNQSTGLCGISDTFKRNRPNTEIKYFCFSIHIGPNRTKSINYTESNKSIILKKAILIRKAAVKVWPLFTTKDAKKILQDLR